MSIIIKTAPGRIFANLIEFSEKSNAESDFYGKMKSIVCSLSKFPYLLRWVKLALFTNFI